jgi:hypothetical protein
MKTMKTQEKIDVQITNVGTVNTAYSLSNPAEWPNFNRV